MLYQTKPNQFFKPFLTYLLIAAMFSIFFLGSCSRADNSMDASRTEAAKITSFDMPEQVALLGIGEPCTKDVPCDPLLDTLEIVGIPDYPDCIFEIQVSYCPTVDMGGNPTYHITHFKWLNSGDCDAYQDDFEEIVIIGDGNSDVFFLNIEDQLYERMEAYFYALGNDGRDCTSGGTVTVEFINTTCNSICIYEEVFTTEGPGHGGLSGGLHHGEGASNLRGPRPIYVYVKQTCASSGCCVRTTRMCFNPDTNMLDKSTVINPLDGTGSDCAGPD